MSSYNPEASAMGPNASPSSGPGPGYVRRQRVQTLARTARPAIVTRPIWRLGSNLRLTRFLA